MARESGRRNFIAEEYTKPETEESRGTRSHVGLRPEAIALSSQPVALLPRAVPESPQPFGLSALNLPGLRKLLASP